VPNAGELSLYERGKPLHVPLTLWYSDREIQLVHAGLVARNGEGVLLAGPGGSGKSTSALTCLGAGFRFLGDDYAGLELRGDGTIVGHSVFGSTWLEPEQLRRFPSLAPHAIHGRLPSERKPMVLLSPMFSDRLERSVPIRALALPRVADAAITRVHRASRAEALKQMVPSSLFEQLLRPGARGFQRLAQLVDRVPTYWLELGRSLESIPRAVEELLAEARWP
jgi:hypothetical protein